jgi:hypothetical protein
MDIGALYEKLNKFSISRINKELTEKLFKEIYQISGVKYEQNNEIIDNISAINKHSAAEKVIHPKINFKYKDSTLEACYVHDIEGGVKLYASVDDKANSNFKNAIESGLAKTFLGSNGIKFLKNSKGEKAGYELKSLSEQSRLFSNKIILGQKNKDYALVLFNSQDNKNHSQISGIVEKSTLETTYVDFEVDIIGGNNMINTKSQIK